MQDLNITEILSYINPCDLNYQEWVNVGMALKDDGYNCSVWDEWSKNDSRYHPYECEKKWNTFSGTSSPVTIATVVQMAKENGLTFGNPENRELDWNDEISFEQKDDLIVVDKHYLEGKEFTKPIDFNPVKELITYLETLFEASENVGYVTETYEKDGKFLPTKGSYSRTAGELIEELSKCNGDIGAVIGDYSQNAGAWIRFNPLDGKGVKNENVTEYRYALIESDTMDLEHQNAIIRELELPIACLVYSGGKSIHGIVKIDATNYEEYRKRVDYLYMVCEKNGFKIDTQNRNPSRLSRMPGVFRNGNTQYIIDTNIGKGDFLEWKEYIESINDDLPDAENLADEWDNLPELSPSLIEGVLRQGHKMLIAGPSKAGKSFALIELCISIAEGLKWLGFNCSKGKILYVNLELDRPSCLHRFKDVYTSLCITPYNLKNIDIWNLRGKSVPMDKLAPKLIRRASKKEYIAIIIDPIYKVITGDENSADQMAHFCNQFDKICTELGTAVIYCHHHSKGGQGSKKSMDRASGSGVFARDPDALIDLIELDIPDSLMKQETNKAIAEVCAGWLKRYDKLEKASQDDLCNAETMKDICRKELEDNSFKLCCEDISAKEKEVSSRSAWRIEGTLREFPKFKPINLWFCYPVHKIDTVGSLKDVQPEDDKPSWVKAKENRKPKEKKAEERKQSFETTYESLLSFNNGKVTIHDFMEATGNTEKTVRNHVNEHKDFVIKNGEILKITR